MSPVLVVDGDAIAREEVTTMLERAGYEALSLPDVYLALARIRAAPPDLVVCDAGEATGGALWLLKTVRDAFPDVPFLMLAEKAEEWDDDVLNTALTRGASDAVLKPIEQERLIAAVERLLPDDMRKGGAPGD